jgi:hypothetical protein
VRRSASRRSRHLRPSASNPVNDLWEPGTLASMEKALLIHFLPVRKKSGCAAG